MTSDKTEPDLPDWRAESILTNDNYNFNSSKVKSCILSAGSTNTATQSQANSVKLPIKYFTDLIFM